MSSFEMNTRPETSVLLIHCIIDDTFSPSHARPSSDAISVHRRRELMSVTNVSVHACVPKEDILAFNATQRVYKQVSSFG